MMQGRADIEQAMAERLQPLGFELVECRMGGTARRPHFTVRIDRLTADTEHGVTVDDCARASRALEAWLDTAGVGEGGRYILEVSSPGVDRPLRKAADWRRFLGRPVDVLVPALGGRFRVTARRVIDPAGGDGSGAEAAGTAVELEFPKGVTRTVPLAEIKEARLGFDW
jgi:ribosome maturation factor RimP